MVQVAFREVRGKVLPEVTSPEVTWQEVTWPEGDINRTGSHGSDRVRMHKHFPRFCSYYSSIFHIISLFNLFFFHIFHIISQFSSRFSISFHYSTYFSSVFSISFSLFNFPFFCISHIFSFFNLLFRRATAAIALKFHPKHEKRQNLR
jgi:hypothetical protein